MATMYPARFLHPDDPKRWAERQTYQALRTLDDEWTIFYSVRWQSLRGGKQADGEADFVAMHPRRGALTIEVKGGTDLRLAGGNWEALDRNGWHWIPNPFEQAHDSKYALRRYLAERVPSFRPTSRMGHFVVFPSIERAAGFGPDAPREIIWDKHDLKSPQTSMDRVVGHWNPLAALTKQQAAAFVAALAPTEVIRRLMRNTVEDVKDQLIQLTSEQFAMLQFLGERRRALITGGAGTGKTVLAVEKARELSAAGFRVLLTCYNAPLGDLLVNEFRPKAGAKATRNSTPAGAVLAGSFHYICRRTAKETGLLPSGTDTDEGWWDIALPDVLPDAIAKLGRQVDAVIVDEGQDFLPNWFLSLELCLRNPESSFFYVFADRQQVLYRRDWQSPLTEAPFPLIKNCRNTIEIAERVNAALGVSGETLGTHGPRPAFLPAPNDQEVVRQVGIVLNRLMNDDNIDARQIVVLATEKRTVELLQGRELAGWRLGDGSNETVLCDTVHRFKGLERDVVILVVPTLGDEDRRRLAYVGMSRAMVLLFVVAPASAQQWLRW